jgi:hypothetical protein
MSFFASSPDAELVAAPGSGLSVVFLVFAVVVLLLALRFVKRAVAPIGAILEAVFAAAMVAFALVVALALIGATLVSMR